MISPFRTIPRFGLPYTLTDFLSACEALVGSTRPPEEFGLLGPSPKFWTASGRQALRLLLEALHLTPEAGVAVPLFTDPSVVSAVVAAGLRPIFVDVEETTLTMDPRSLAAARGKFDAVVIVHLFGHLADIPALLASAGPVPVIEDTAHAPLSFLEGRMAGTFAAACFYSFASTKYWSAGGGGLAVINHRQTVDNFAALVGRLGQPSRWSECPRLVMQAAKALVFTRMLYGIAGRPMRRWVERFSLLEPPMDTFAIRRSHAAVARRQALRFPNRVERQRTNSLRLLANLTGLDDVTLPRERPGARYNYHLFPALLRDSEERAAVAAAMWAKGVDTSKIYFDVADQCRRYGYQGGCPVSESVAERLLTLPNHAALAEEDIDRVAEVFLGALRMWRGAGRSEADASLLASSSPQLEERLP